MPEVPRGSLFIGDKINPSDHKRTNDFVMYEAANLTTHGVIVGMTGSGKTGLGIVMLEECLLQGIPVLIIDPKGDMGNLLLSFPDGQPSDYEPYVLESDAKKEGRTVAEHAAAVAQMWQSGQSSWDQSRERVAALKTAAEITIYTPGSTVGVPLNIVGNMQRPDGALDAETQQDEIDGLVSSLLNLIGIDSDPLSGREHILLSNLIANAWQNGQSVDLATLVGQIQQPPMRKLGVIDLDTFFPEKDRLALALKLNGLIASPAFASWAQGVPLDIPQLLYSSGGKPNAAIIQLSHLSDQERQFVVTLVLSKMVTWMRQQSGTPDLRAMIYMDEVFGFVPPTAAPPAKKPILTIFKQARAFGLGIVLATQNPVDIDYKAISNAGTWMIGRLQTERDKARLLEGLKDAAGSTDLDEIDATISGLAKREFLLHSSKSNKPVLFTSRWALSYLPGPLSRDQISALMAKSPQRAAAAAAPVASQAPGSAAAPPALGDDESNVAPKVADGTPVYYLDAAAPWAQEIGASSSGKRLQAAVVARVNLVFDEEKAGVRHTQEWEAVWFPLDGPLDAASARSVDYDARDFRATPPEGAIYVLPAAEIKAKTYFTKAKTELQDHLFRTMSIDVWKNPELKLFSRVGESHEDFAVRCAQLADDETDKEADKIRQSVIAKMDRVKDALEKAEDRVREVQAEKKRRGLDTVVSVAGGLLGGLLGGRKKTKSILSTIGRATSKTGAQRATGERLETAENRVEQQAEELTELEAELAGQLEAIASKWDERAVAIEALAIELEKTDISVDEIALVWVPVQ